VDGDLLQLVVLVEPPELAVGEGVADSDRSHGREGGLYRGGQRGEERKRSERMNGNLIAGSGVVGGRCGLAWRLDGGFVGAEAWWVGALRSGPRVNAMILADMPVSVCRGLRSESRSGSRDPGKLDSTPVFF